MLTLESRQALVEDGPALRRGKLPAGADPGEADLLAANAVALVLLAGGEPTDRDRFTRWHGVVPWGVVRTCGSIGNDQDSVLFLDELPEFARRSIEVLRQPLENGRVTIARALRPTTFPARFVLVAAMNPCPCGFLGDRATPAAARRR